MYPTNLANTYVCHLGSCAIADGVFIGPYDLSLALGFPPPSPDPHPEVEKVIQQILVAAHAKGKKWYAQTFSPAPVRR